VARSKSSSSATGWYRFALSSGADLDEEFIVLLRKAHAI